jgi:hypothetical protein
MQTKESRLGGGTRIPSRRSFRRSSGRADLYVEQLRRVFKRVRTEVGLQIDRVQWILLSSPAPGEAARSSPRGWRLSEPARPCPRFSVPRASLGAPRPCQRHWASG